MRVHYTENFLKSYAQAPLNVRKSFDKQAHFLVADLWHGSLQAKKYGGSKNVWQARVTKSWRFYFTVQGDTYHLLDILPHSK